MITSKSSAAGQLLAASAPKAVQPLAFRTLSRPGDVSWRHPDQPSCSYSLSYDYSLAVSVRRRSVAAKAAPVTSAPPQLTAVPEVDAGAVQPDLVLDAPDSSGKVYVFGVDHRDPTPNIGHFILRTRPDAVVVETCLTPEHGAVPGTVISCEDQLVQGPSAFFVRMFCQVAAKLKEVGGEDPSSSELWQEVRKNFRGEQLAYIAAFTTGAKLIFGDRPKDITYRRLHSLVTAAELDEAFGFQVAAHYRNLVGAPQPDLEALMVPVAEQIMMQEREAVMCKVVEGALGGCLPQGGVTSPCSSVVLVVGAGHLPGIKYLWNGGRWREMVGSPDLTTSAIMSTQPSRRGARVVGHMEDARATGLRRGLLLALMRMCVTAEVMEDMDTVLGAVPDAQMPAVEAISEIYGSTRTMLACLPRDLLAQVCSGYKCDMYEALEPLRALRPMNGGPGYSEEMVQYVRSLNFELD